MKYKYGSEEYKETRRVYFFIRVVRGDYPSKQEVEAIFRALAELGILSDSFTTADVAKALEQYDTSNGLSITYKVKYAFLESMFEQFAPKFAAMRKTGGPGHDVEGTMLLNKDPEVIHARFDKLESGDTGFVVMAIDVGRADDAAWGFDDYADCFEMEETIETDDKIFPFHCHCHSS